MTLRKTKQLRDMIDEFQFLRRRIEQRELRSGLTIASGKPGNPAPVPISAIRVPRRNGWIERLSSRCLVICCAALADRGEIHALIPVVELVEQLQQASRRGLIERETELSRSVRSVCNIERGSR